jgi:hypothetical protein
MVAQSKQNKGDKDATAAVGEHVKRFRASFGVVKAPSDSMIGFGLFLQVVSLLLFSVPNLAFKAFG